MLQLARRAVRLRGPCHRPRGFRVGGRVGGSVAVPPRVPPSPPPPSPPPRRRSRSRRCLATTAAAAAAAAAPLPYRRALLTRSLPLPLSSFRRLSNEAGAPAGAPDSNAASSSSGAPDDEEAAAAPDGLALALLQRRGVGAGPSGLVAASDAAGYPSPASHHTAKCSPPEGSESGRATCGDAGDLGSAVGLSPPTAA